MIAHVFVEASSIFAPFVFLWFGDGFDASVGYQVVYMTLILVWYCHGLIFWCFCIPESWRSIRAKVKTLSIAHHHGLGPCHCLIQIELLVSILNVEITFNRDFQVLLLCSFALDGLELYAESLQILCGHRSHIEILVSNKRHNILITRTILWLLLRRIVLSQIQLKIANFGLNHVHFIPSKAGNPLELVFTCKLVFGEPCFSTNVAWSNIEFHWRWRGLIIAPTPLHE